MSDRMSRPKHRQARKVTLWLPPEAWDCLEQIAARSECSVSEVIETALDDWAEAASVAIETIGVDSLQGVGSFEIFREKGK